jgi:hypothetical protein
MNSETLSEVKWQFLSDIEARGGITNIGRGNKYTPSSIFAERPEFYAPYRDECLNLVYYLRRRNKTQYRKYLDDHKVLPASLKRPVSRVVRFDDDDDDEVEEQEQEQEKMSTTGGPGTRGGGARGGGARGGGVSNAPTAVLSSTLLNIACCLLHLSNLMLAHLCFVVTIPVDIDNLWKVQHPFKVYSAESIQGNTHTKDTNGEFFKGFIITMEVCPRDVLGTGAYGMPSTGQFEFVASITAKNQVSIEAPILNYTSRGGDDDAIELLLQQDNLHDNVFWEALQNQRREWAKSKRENKMVYILDFGPNVELSSKVLEIHKHKTDGTLYEEAMPITVPVGAFPSNERVPVLDKHGNQYVIKGHKISTPVVFKYFAGMIYWCVADRKQDSRKAKVADANSDTAAADAMFKRMGL